MGRTFAAIATAAVLLAACAGPADPEVGADAGGAADAATAAPASTVSPGTPREPLRETSQDCEPGQFHFEQIGCEPAHSVPLHEIISGGPPPDGIPPIDEPVFESIDAASEWLEPTSPVMVVDVAGDARAYPLAILTWHEIVNDEVAGIPLVVTYCPLCNSALVFDRTIDGPDGVEVLDFGTSGRLYLSNLVMYDRQTRNLWTQFEGEGIVGEEFLGERLDRLPAWLLGFEEFVELHPDGQVLSRETGHQRNYGRNPYAGYDDEDSLPFLFEGALDERFAPMARFVGVADGDEATAIGLEVLADERLVATTLGSREIVTLWAPGQASALDRGAIDEGRDVGQTAVFDLALDGVELDLQATDDGFADAASGSTLDLRGWFTDGPLEGRALEAIPHDDTFWFVWVAFRPDTEVVVP
ncbi:MAG: DUF3179 domain-containing protein [Nitriliruptoraceae bacterium]|nr:DUF3179 domain-containing protein [Nitriliruptoraceae bacterium]